LIDSYVNLTEGLLRAFNLVWLLKILTKYKVLGVEQEIQAPLSGDILFMSRPDAILQDKSTGELGIWSIKSTSRWDEIKELENKVDVQGLSESWAVETLTGQKVSWVQMFYIITGSKEKTEDGPIHISPAVYGWFKESGFSTTEISPSYTKGWKRFSATEEFEGGLQGWIDYLSKDGKTLEALFVCPPAWFRNSESIEEWKESTLYQEDKIRVASQNYSVLRMNGYQDRILREYFPMFRGSCIRFRKKCDFFSLCHGTAGEVDDPLAHGFQWRKGNHPVEMEGLK
jgi:hypothetical protein